MHRKQSQTTAPRSGGRRSTAADAEVVVVDGAAADAADDDDGERPAPEPMSPMRRGDELSTPSRPSLRLSPLLSAMPPDLVERFHYLVARLQLSDHELLSPIGIVAANHGEGVTTVTRALGTVLANDLDATVCIVDLSSPVPPNRADPSVVGLFDVVEQSLPLSQALRTTADDRLMVLGSGVGSPAEARQLIRTQAMADVFRELSTMFDYVLLDVPPILINSSGVAMLRHAKSFIMVTRHGRTTIDQVRAVGEELKSLTPVGVVMNHVSTSIPKRLRRLFAV